MAWVADDVFTIHHGWVRAYAAEMRRRGLLIPFECISRADRLNEEIVDVFGSGSDLRVGRNASSMRWSVVCGLSKCRRLWNSAAHEVSKAECF
jgi:hypothetical protein